MKIGRNDYCSCGSGKKYKYCCGLNEEMNSTLLQNNYSRDTWGVIDDYMRLFEAIVAYGNILRQSSDNGKELQETYANYEKILCPGKKKGITDSLFMSWFCLDFRFGDDQQTICERFLKSEYIDKLARSGPAFIKKMSDSYFTFYALKDVLKDYLIFKELHTCKEWKVNRLHEPFEKEAKKDDVWFMRLIGNPFGSFLFGTPYIFPADSKEHLTGALKTQKEIFLKMSPNPLSEEDAFRQSCKAATIVWAERIVNGYDLDGPKPGSQIHTQMPKLQNTDGEELLFSKVFFKIKKHEGLAEKLSSIKDFEYNKQNKDWTWLKKGNEKIKTFPNTVLGRLFIEGEYLIAEANSVKRALQLKDNLTRKLSPYLHYENMEVKDLSSMPPISEEEKKKMEEERKKLYSDPEVREFVRKKAEDYYHNDWMKQKIPMLDYKTPSQAIKTKEGKLKVMAILDSIEKTQEASPDEPFKADVNGLRKKLGLSTDSRENEEKERNL